MTLTPKIAIDIRRVGDRGLLLAAPDGPATMADLIRRADLVGVEDLLPAAETVLVTLRPGSEPADVEHAVRDLLAADSAAPAESEDESVDVTIHVRYDGEDLPDVARLLGISVEEVIAEHTRREWRCRFIGFTAGFGYLEPDRPCLVVPRRDQSRTAVPPGAVALADGYSAVYPRRAPGGWQLIGTTDEPMWDLDRSRPALLAPGTRVRFVRVDG